MYTQVKKTSNDSTNELRQVCHHGSVQKDKVMQQAAVMRGLIPSKIALNLESNSDRRNQWEILQSKGENAVTAEVTSFACPFCGKPLAKFP